MYNSLHFLGPLTRKLLVVLAPKDIGEGTAQMFFQVGHLNHVQIMVSAIKLMVSSIVKKTGKGMLIVLPVLKDGLEVIAKS